MTNTQTSRPSRQRSQFLAAVMTVALTLLAGQATSWANHPGQAVVATGVQAERVKPASGVSPSMDQSYASREAKAKDLEKFKGGDMVIIGSSTLVIVLVVLLILVII